MKQRYRTYCEGYLVPMQALYNRFIWNQSCRLEPCDLDSSCNTNTLHEILLWLATRGWEVYTLSEIQNERVITKPWEMVLWLVDYLQWNTIRLKNKLNFLKSYKYYREVEIPRVRVIYSTRTRTSGYDLQLKKSKIFRATKTDRRIVTVVVGVHHRFGKIWRAKCALMYLGKMLKCFTI